MNLLVKSDNIELYLSLIHISAQAHQHHQHTKGCTHGKNCGFLHPAEFACTVVERGHRLQALPNANAPSSNGSMCDVLDENGNIVFYGLGSCYSYYDNSLKDVYKRQVLP